MHYNSLAHNSNELNGEFRPKEQDSYYSTLFVFDRELGNY